MGTEGFSQDPRAKAINTELVGARLKKIRLEKGLSLEEAHKKTKIHLNILKALEGDSLTDLSPIYLKSFLKIYCGFLGVDFKEFVPDYKEAKKQSIAETKPLNPKPDTGIKLAGLKSTAIKFPSFQPSRKIKKIFILAVFCVITLVVFFNLGKFLFSRKPRQVVKEEAKPVSLTNAPVKPQKAAVKSKTPAAALKPQARNTPDKKEGFISGITLTIKARSRSYVALKVDGRTVFQSNLEKGRSDTWIGKEKMELTLGDAGAVELEVNGQRFENLGRKGKSLKNILINKQGLHTGR